MKGVSAMRGAAIGLGLSAVLGAGMLVPSAAVAADGVPFDPAKPAVLIGYDAPTTLARTALGASGRFDLDVIRPAGSVSYNALGFNTEDNYLYAMNNDTQGLLRIDSTGAIEPLGAVAGLPTAGFSYNQGTFGLGADAGTYYVRSMNHTGRMWAIDIATQQASEIVLSEQVPNVSDIVYRDGFVWAYDGRTADSRLMYRIDPHSGATSVFDISSLGLTAQPYGGQWLYGNGNIGLTGNTDGTVYQIAIMNGDSANPGFQLVSRDSGEPTANNDAASIMGPGADLAVTKSGDETFTPGEAYAYTITVKNNGAGVSSGSRVVDELPAGLTSPSTATAGCSITSGTLNCTVGTLASGASTTIRVSGTAANDATVDSLRNTVTVDGNEADPNMGNNTATFAPRPPVVPAPSLGLVKSADVAQVSSVGEKVTYSFVVTNTGNVDVADVSVTEGSFSGHGTLGDVVCPAEADVLVPAEKVTCTAVYTVVAADLTDEPIVNTATASGTAPGGAAVESSPATARVTTVAPVTPTPSPTATPTVTPKPSATPKPAGSSLATTGGADMTGYGIAALILVAAGAGVLAIRRRRA
ncbi:MULTISPECIES: DUF6923 family protein [Bacteria]|uniref:DUF6923 family protein n=1 Tax=Bacteria TaxID=2 RepID=UPI003C7D0C2B